MSPREFHHLALQLVNESSPAHLRTAVSRAYYAAFHVGVEILSSMGFRISTGTAGHGEVRHLLNNTGDPEISKVGSQISDLHSKRLDADYRLYKKSTENKKTANALVKQAGRMIAILDTRCSGSERSRIITAIKEYKELTRS